ncbi:MAG: IS1595 family transposase [Planctomycetota bacterium]|nr:MAG: IS1595 family transposase [Planctomycetota bacterium]
MTRGIKPPPDPILEALRLAATDERIAAEFLEARRWGDQPACPRCGAVAVYSMRSADGERNKDHRWRCRECKRMFTVRTGTVLEESRIPLRHWCHAFWRAVSSKKGVSALQISRECRISYKSALYLMHRIRAAVSDKPGEAAKLSGTVEMDATWVGGKPRYKGISKRGRGTKNAPVFGIVERGGELRLNAVERITSKTLKAAIAASGGVDPTTRLMSDEGTEFIGIGRALAGGHQTVKHKAKEYVRGEVHNNTIEGAFSILQRGVYGTFHSISRKHLPRYLAEFEFRYNTRKLSDSERVGIAIRKAQGKRLLYADQVAGR